MNHARGICTMSGFEYALSDLVRDWRGLLVHPQFADKRNPQDHLRGVKERTLPYTSPEGADVFLSTNEVQPEDL